MSIRATGLDLVPPPTGTTAPAPRSQGPASGIVVPSAEVPYTAAQQAWFWSRVCVATDPWAHWPWAGTEGTWLPTGHVRIWFADTGERWLIHRLAYVLNGGDLSDGDLIRHRCPDGDVLASCAHPQHLSAGTSLQNAQDRDRAGRRTPHLPQGASHWSARLTQVEADRIRAARSLGITADDLAVLYDVSRSTVYAIWANQRYRRMPTDAEAAPASRLSAGGLW